MLKKLEIKYFQSHKHTVLSFEKGINAITGTSDAGKSSIIRALKWLFFNRPRGNDFLSDFAEDKSITSVKAIFTDVIVERCKGSDVNSYIITPILSDGKLGSSNLCKALRSDVPEEVKSALLINDINFQEQHSPYFLLNNTPGEVSSTFNRVAKLEIMDACMIEASKIVREIKSKEKILLVQEEETKKDLEKFDWISDAQKLVDDTVKIESLLSTINSEIGNLSSLCGNYNKIKKNLVELEYVLSAETTLNSIMRLHENRALLQDKIKSIQTVIDNRNRLKSQISNISYVKQAIIDFEEIDSIKKDFDSLILRKERISIVIDQLKKLKRAKFRKQKNIQSLQSEFDTALEKIGFCPLCDSMIEHNY